MMHTHSPYATALGMLENGRMEVDAHAGLTFFEDEIAYSDERDEPDAGFGRSGLDVARWLGEKTVLFIRNHGIVVVGPSIPVVYTDTFLIERTSQYQMIAMASGLPIRLNKEGPHAFENEAEALAVRERHFAAMKRVLDHTQPDYAK